MPVTIRATDTTDVATHNAILNGLLAYNTSRTGRSDFRGLALAVEDDSGAVVGGLWGRTTFDWLFVDLLFVPESLRGHGVGRDLMLQAEEEAIGRGCHNAWLDTFSFQARGFYEGLGYECFGELPEYPAGFARYFMKKRLDAAP